MVDLNDDLGFVNVTRIETTTVALGGDEVNQPNFGLKQLASRDRWLRDQLEELFGLGNAVQQATTQEFTQVGVSSIAQGRLTTVSGDPVGQASGVSNIYYTPYNGDYIALYDTTNTRWDLRQFTERSLDISALSAQTNYDIFAYWDGSAVTLQAVPWATQGFGVSARAQAISQQNGTWVKDSDKRRYLGSIRTTSAGQTESSDVNEFVWNVQNQISRALYATESVAYNYNNVAFRYANNSTTSARVSLIVGLNNMSVATVVARVGMASGGRGLSVAIGENSDTTVPPIAQQPAQADAAGTIQTFRGFTIPLGANFYNTLESTSFSSNLRNPALLMQVNV